MFVHCWALWVIFFHHLWCCCWATEEGGRPCISIICPSRLNCIIFSFLNPQIKVIIFNIFHNTAITIAVILIHSVYVCTAWKWYRATCSVSNHSNWRCRGKVMVKLGTIIIIKAAQRQQSSLYITTLGHFGVIFVTYWCDVVGQGPLSRYIVSLSRHATQCIWDVFSVRWCHIIGKQVPLHDGRVVIDVMLMKQTQGQGQRTSQQKLITD